jgi:ABC-type proline/glycine betaine transport system substrate-binding protein/ABC-type amino acid transport substrate-binding protein
MAKRLCLVIGIGVMLMPAAGIPVAAKGQPKLYPVVAEKSPPAEKSVSMARATWDTGWFQAEIFKLLLERLGYRVAGPRTYDTHEFYRALARGEVDLWANGWFPLHNAFVSDAAVHSRIERVGYEVRGGALQGYLIDKPSAETYGITDLDDLKDPEVARIFDANGNGKADLIGCNVGWGCELVIEHHLDVYRLRDTVEHIQGDYSLMMHDTVARFRQGQPVLFYTWTPNWTVGTLIPGKDVVWLQVPFASLPNGQQGLEDQAVIADLEGCGADPCAVGWPPNDIRVVANSEFLKNNPAVRRLLESVVIPLADIDAQNARMVSGKGAAEDIRRHALQWIEVNQAKVRKWLTAARSVLETGAPEKKKAVDHGPLGVAAAASPLRVATMLFEPFVIFQGRQYTGFSIDLWNEIAEEIGLNYEIYGVNSLAKLLDDVERQAADLATAGIGITSLREMSLDFSHAYFESGLQIMVRGGSESFLGGVFPRVISVIFSSQVLYVIGLLLILLLISAHIIWISERGRNPQFAQGYLKGIWQSFWWAAVTVTTVGYGDKTPRGIAGRVFALIWMFSGFFILAYFTASVTSTVTVEKLQGTIEGPKDLHGKAVATVRGSTAAEYLQKMGVHPKRLANAREAIRVLQEGEVDAVVYDAPVLQHYAAGEGAGKVAVVGPIFWQQNYGIALPTGSPYREPINRALLRLIETGEYQLLYKKWFGADEF